MLNLNLTSMRNELPIPESVIQTLETIKIFIADNLDIRYAPKQLAKEFSKSSQGKYFVTTNFIKKYFQAYFGKHPYEVIKELRMQEAAVLVLDETNELQQIADNWGITKSSLCRMFKAYHGMTITRHRLLANKLLPNEQR